ncbi:hypothetical protein CTA21_16310 [Salmonella enterica]|nr:hypothetical protein [Salmonella enterica]EDZ0839903.1 hypothetical protein [Salmonella enterica subsp. enterica serovar Saintpaul]EEC1302901.1 hypothetical protein [Salmonella enterica]
MIQLFGTPRAYKRASFILMAINMGNIITFTTFFDHWTDNGLLLQGLFVMVFHVLTIIALTFTSARFAAAGSSMKRFIAMMEANGFVYDETTKEFKTGRKM